MKNYAECPSCHQKQLESKSDYCGFCYSSFKTNNIIKTDKLIVDPTEKVNAKKSIKERFAHVKDSKLIAINIYFIFSIVFMAIISRNIIIGDKFRFFTISFIVDVIFIGLFLIRIISQHKKLQLKHAVMSITILFIASLLVSSVNYILSSPIQSYKVNVISKYITNRKAPTCRLEISSWKGEKELIDISPELWESIEVGSKHIIKIRRGGLGIDTFYNFY
ncbi:MAG: hypothetical protein H7263_13145 [Candidatus Sericytochromatia bacterium]|nr:hypothetical protein [Candidatus Sericytochromatia bacterium]